VLKGSAVSYRLAIVDDDPVGVELGRGVGRSGVKRRSLALRHLRGCTKASHRQ